MKCEQNLYSNEEMFLNIRSSLAKIWKASKLPAVFYHTTFIENALSILKEKRVVANKGQSLCKEKNGLVSLSDRITKGNVEFFGNVIFEFDALSLFLKNKSIAPKKYGSSKNINDYDETPLFENEWTVPRFLRFQFKDINKVIFITSRNFRKSTFRDIVRMLEIEGIEFTFIVEKWFPDNVVTDMTSYVLRVRRWKKFNKTKKYV
jgi:hypothetical protein